MAERPNFDKLFEKLDQIYELAGGGNVPFIGIVPTDEEHEGCVSALARTPNEIKSMGVAALLFLLRSLPPSDQVEYVESLNLGFAATLKELGHERDLGTDIGNLASKAGAFANEARGANVPFLAAIFYISERRVRSDYGGGSEQMFDLVSATLASVLDKFSPELRPNFVAELLNRPGA